METGGKKILNNIFSSRYFGVLSKKYPVFITTTAIGCEGGESEKLEEGWPGLLMCTTSEWTECRLDSLCRHFDTVIL